MKELLFFSTMFMQTLIFTSIATAQDTIMLQGKKVFYLGEPVKKISELDAIIQKVGSEEANQLFYAHKSNIATANVIAWTGVAISAVGLGVQVRSLSQAVPSNLEGQNSTGYGVVLGGAAVTLIGSLIASSSWKKNGKQAIDIYNQKILMAKESLSLHFTLSDQILGLRFEICF